MPLALAGSVVKCTGTTTFFPGFRLTDLTIDRAVMSDASAN